MTKAINTDLKNKHYIHKPFPANADLWAHSHSPVLMQMGIEWSSYVFDKMNKNNKFLSNNNHIGHDCSGKWSESIINITLTKANICKLKNVLAVAE